MHIIYVCVHNAHMLHMDTYEFLLVYALPEQSSIFLSMLWAKKKLL